MTPANSGRRTGVGAKNPKKDKKPSVLRKVGRGAAWAMLPMQFVDNLRGTGAQARRIGDMLSGRDVDPNAGLSAKDIAAKEEGRTRLVEELDDRARFEHFYQALGLGPADVAGRLVQHRRTHAIRLACLWLTAVLAPAAIFNYGVGTLIFDVAACRFLYVCCRRDTAYIVQLEERALYHFDDIRKRPDFWRRCLLTF